MQLESDSELLTSIGRGDVIAFERLYDRYGAVVYAVAARVAGDGAAQDAVVDAFVALRKANTAALDRPGPKPVLRWLVERVVAHAR